MTRFPAGVASTALALVLFGFFHPSHAQEAVSPDLGLHAGVLLLQGRIAGILPYNQHTTLDVIGGQIDAPAQVLPDFDVTYFLTDHLAISGEAGVLRTKIIATGTLIGTLPIGKVWTASLVTAVQWHFLPREQINPYVGAGASASWYFGEQPAGGYVTHFTVDPQVAPMIQAGVDYHLTGNWYGNFDIKQTFVPVHKISSGNGAGAKISLDVLVIGAGIGYRF